ncbi:MAG: ferredoxin--NADP reductase [Legionella sp.]|nr:ferredoxin--NADP reductase [Legionella sp.]
MSMNTFTATLQESFMISPKVKHFIFSCTETPPFHFIPGQFISIHFEHEQTPIKRSYSISNAPKKDNVIEFAAGYFENGPGTNYLYQLKPGDKVEMSGPFGRLILREEATPKRYILVATSTGTTPYRAMLNELAHKLENNPELQVVIMQGVQRREEILYAEDFQSLTEKYSGARFVPFLSRQPLDTLLSHERSGYVQHGFDELNLHPEQDLVYLCGNPGMIDDAFNYLKEQGFAMQQIIREKYISR